MIDLRYFHEPPRLGAWFEGYYFKHRGPDGGIALIPAVHREADGAGLKASLQVITDDRSYTFNISNRDFSAKRKQLAIRVGESRISAAGAALQITGEGLELSGTLRYGPLTPLRTDIMGPFRLAEPVMQCCHGVVSLRHSLSGTLVLNGKPMCFDGGTGYIETDRGRSFPADYLWTQCNWDRNCIMLSVAEIPFLGRRFKGCICALLHGGREYRLATYLGVKSLRYGPRGAEIRQGAYHLTAELLSGDGRPLRAPSAGAMTRTIHESLSARVRYRFWIGSRLLFDHIDENASYEYADEKDG